MKRKTHISKSILFGIILLGISIPMIQHVTGFANVRALKGAVVLNEAPELSDSTWLYGHYQDQVDKYLNDQFGFRPSYVRLHNQVKYSLFNDVNANGVIIGKDWYMYEWNYIRAYHGLDFVGDSLISEKTRKLKVIQDKLSAKGKTLLVVLAPGKGSFFPEFFPDSSKREKGRSNYQGYLDFMEKDSVNYVDFQAWFLKNKGKTAYPLYGKGGIHWSKYGEILVADSLIHHIEKLSGNDLPEIVLDRVTESGKNKHGDYDIGEGLNIIFQTPTYPMGYPEFHIEEEDKNTTRTLFVADSYYWGMFGQGFATRIFNDGEFWFYNNQIYPQSAEQDLLVETIDIVSKVEENDVVVLMSTDANLYSFAFGFIDRLYNEYTK
ncbi:MAG: alginate O-acetyltransferase AlgX-related protein [Crocinitomicaceae bacterium]